MPSVCDLALTITAAQVTLLVGHKALASIFGSASREEIQADDQLESCAKDSIKSPKPFSRDIGDWTAWKIDTRSSLGLMGLAQALDGRDFTIRHQTKNTMVYHLPLQAVAKGTASRTFTRARFLYDGNTAWKLLVERNEGVIQREPEAKRTRASLANLRLDLRMSGFECQKKIRNMSKD